MSAVRSGMNLLSADEQWYGKRRTQLQSESRGSQFAVVLGHVQWSASVGSARVRGFERASAAGGGGCHHSSKLAVDLK